LQQGTDINNLTDQVHKGMEERARETGSTAVQHTADVIKAQHDLLADKKILERFDRISKQLEEIKRQSPQDFERTRQQIQALRPLLRLSVRSVDFRKTCVSFLRVFKHVWEDNVEGSMEMVIEKGEKQGIKPAVEKAQKIGEKSWERAKEKEKVISDEDWEKMTDSLDEIFTALHQHPNYRRGIKELFELPSVLGTQLRENVAQGPAARLQEESKDLIAQFSGREALDELFDKIQELRRKFEGSDEAGQWWEDLKCLIEKIAKDYSDKSIFDELRAHLNKGQDIFDDIRPLLNDIIDRLSTIFDNMSNDDYVRDLQERLSIVANDFYWVDSEGNKRLDYDAAGDISAAVGEAIRQQLSHFDLGVVSGDSQGARYTLDNLTIDAQIPEKISLHLESDAVLNTGRDTGSKKFENELNVSATLRGIKMCAKGLHFSYNSSTIMESGVMDVCIPSADLVIDFVYSTPAWSTRESKLYQFSKASTQLSVYDLDINFHTDTLRHPILSPMLTSLFKAYLIAKFEYGVQEVMNNGMKEVGTKISELLSQSPYSLSVDSFTRGFNIE